MALLGRSRIKGCARSFRSLVVLGGEAHLGLTAPTRVR